MKMTYFEDLSVYNYSHQWTYKKTLNVGWLGRGFDYTSGVVEEKFIDRLWLFCLTSVPQTRGFHECELCSNPAIGPLVFEHNLQKIKLGRSEIRVFGKHGIVYAAPNLIMHYVCDHHYQPPIEFIEAVLSSELPSSKKYDDRMRNLGIQDWPPPSLG